MMKEGRIMQNKSIGTNMKKTDGLPLLCDIFKELAPFFTLDLGAGKEA